MIKILAELNAGDKFKLSHIPSMTYVVDDSELKNSDGFPTSDVTNGYIQIRQINNNGKFTWLGRPQNCHADIKVLVL